MYTCGLLAWSNFRVVVTLAILLVRGFQNLLRAKLDTHQAFFASLRDEINLPMRDGYLVEIDRYSSKYSHRMVWTYWSVMNGTALPTKY
jgi:hypothetical protein